MAADSKIDRLRQTGKEWLGRLPAVLQQLKGRVCLSGPAIDP